MVHVVLHNGIKKILIENTLHSSDMLVLKKELSLGLNKITYEISFINIDSIPSWLVKLILDMQAYITIETTHRALWAYLSKLGIKNHLKSNYEITDSKIQGPIKALAIGGSAGSIEKILALIEVLPYADISIFIVVHLLANKKSHFVSILKNITQYEVQEASHNTQVKNNCIYVAAPDYHLSVIDNYMYLDKSATVNFSRPSIDITFVSLAYEYKSSLIAVLLCGYGSDGSRSLEDLKQNHCKVLIEDPSECQAKDMILNAIYTHNYTKVLTIKAMGQYLASLLSVEVDIEDEIQSFLENIKLVYGYDFKDYNRKSLMRRTDLTMKQSMIRTFAEFKKRVFDDEVLFAKLLSNFSINVTTFFRNPEVFKSLRENVIPILETYPSIRVWCAGCSRGDEPYSVAIMLDELGLLHKSLIYATDFNPRVLKEAQNALFPREDFIHFKSNYRESAGKKDLEDWFEMEENFVSIKEHIKKKVLFFEHNLVTDDSINDFHLIFCRNVLIYFNKNLQGTVFKTIDNSLYGGGFLVLGESENLPQNLKYKILENKIYKKMKKR